MDVETYKHGNVQMREYLKNTHDVDNMMNLDLLFTASKLSGDSKYYEVAVKHAQTHQGKNDESAWSRGQA